jgi:hypothetical protein
MRAAALFVALIATALALGPALAHLFALPNKIVLSREEYFIAQKAYAGWNRLAVILAIQLAGIVIVAILVRHDPTALTASLVALAGLIGAQTVFWAFTQPANVATGNWTAPPAAWDTLRRQWEYSHAAGAGLQLLTLAALIVVALRR